MVYYRSQPRIREPVQRTKLLSPMILEDYLKKKLIVINYYFLFFSFNLKIEMLREAEEFAEQDKLAKERIDAKNSLESYVYSMKN